MRTREGRSRDSVNLSARFSCIGASVAVFVLLQCFTSTDCYSKESALATVEPLQGKPVPEVSATDLRGNRITLSEYLRGRPGLLLFWSPFSNPSIDVLRFVDDQKRAGRYPDLVCLTFLLTDDTKLYAARDFQKILEELAGSFSMPTIQDISPRGETSGPIARLFDVRWRIPTIVLVQRDGVIRRVIRGYVEDASLLPFIQEVAEPKM